MLDDSSDSDEKTRVDVWAASHKDVRIVRRSHRMGYKGGNINHWLENFGAPIQYPFVLVIDADETVPPDFTLGLLRRIASGNYSFVQGCHIGVAQIRTRFQAIFHLQVECEWFYQVPGMNILGSPPMLGHGVLIRTESLREVGGFPNVISEDLGLTILFAEKGLTGIVEPASVGLEEFPSSYEAYWKRRRRWIQADAEIVRRLLRKLWYAHIPWTARLTLVVREMRLPLASAYWFVLSVTALSGVLDVKTGYSMSPYGWALLIDLMGPSLPSLLVARLPILSRLRYVVAMPFLGLAASALHPPASVAGLLGRGHFMPTGSRITEGDTRLRFYSIWEIASGLLYLSGGLAGANYALVAVGFAVVFSPILRTCLGSKFLATGVAVFWGLLSFQIVLDVAQGSMPVEHLFALVGLTINLI